MSTIGFQAASGASSHGDKSGLLPDENLELAIDALDGVLISHDSRRLIDASHLEISNTGALSLVLRDRARSRIFLMSLMPRVLEGLSAARSIEMIYIPDDPMRDVPVKRMVPLYNAPRA